MTDPNLIEAHDILVESRGEVHKDTRDYTQALVDLYTTWNAADRDATRDANAAPWKTKLDAIQPTADERNTREKK